MTEFGREYGEGMYALCAEEKIERDALLELQELRDAFAQNPDFVRLLGNMALSKQERVGIVEETFQGGLHEYVLNFLKLLVERGGIYAFAECVDAYRDCYNRDHQVAQAEITTAQPLNDAQRERLRQKLQSLSGREVVIKEKVDPSVLGGVVLQMDGKRYDNTVLHRLQAIKQAMTGG